MVTSNFFDDPDEEGDGWDGHDREEDGSEEETGVIEETERGTEEPSEGPGEVDICHRHCAPSEKVGTGKGSG